MFKIEVEIDTLEQPDDALALSVDAVLLDNMSPEELARAVNQAEGRLIIEASGSGVTAARLAVPRQLI